MHVPVLRVVAEAKAETDLHSEGRAFELVDLNLAEFGQCPEDFGKCLSKNLVPVRYFI